MRTTVIIALVAGALLAAGCGSSSKPATPVAAPKQETGSAAVPTSCRAEWRAGWQKLANEIRAPVFCPTWMPQPLDAKMGGRWFNGRFVDPDRSYLVSFVWQETSATDVQEVHVNFRGYPGRTSIPICEDTLTVNGKTVHPKIPCFGDAHRGKRFGPRTVTVYTANQGVDQWHVLFAWLEGGSLYTISEHVAPPNTYVQVVANLSRMMRGLVRLQPAA